MKKCRFYILNTIATLTRHTDTSLLTYLFRPSGDLQGVEDVLQICCILLRAVTISSCLAFTASRASLRSSCSFLPSVRLDKTLSLASISLWAQETTVRTSFHPVFLISRGFNPNSLLRRRPYRCSCIIARQTVFLLMYLFPIIYGELTKSEHELVRATARATHPQ